MLIYVKRLIILVLFLEQARGLPTWSVPATWWLQTPRCWPLVCLNNLV